MRGFGGPFAPTGPYARRRLAGDSPETRRSTPNPQTTTNMLSLIPKMGNRTVGCAERPLFPAGSGNKLISDRRSEVLRRVSGESTGRLPTCPRRWAERAAAGEGPTARLFGAPTWVGGVNQDSGKWQRRGPKHRQATDWCPAPPGEIRMSFGVQALPGAGTVATCIGPPQPNASAVNGLSTAENLPCLTLAATLFLLAGPANWRHVWLCVNFSESSASPAASGPPSGSSRTRTSSMS